MHDKFSERRQISICELILLNVNLTELFFFNSADTTIYTIMMSDSFIEHNIPSIYQQNTHRELTLYVNFDSILDLGKSLIHGGNHITK